MHAWRDALPDLRQLRCGRGSLVGVARPDRVGRDAPARLPAADARARGARPLRPLPRDMRMVGVDILIRPRHWAVGPHVSAGSAVPARGPSHRGTPPPPPAPAPPPP